MTVTAERRAKADEIAAELAKSLSVGRIRREGRSFIVPSRTRIGLYHRVTLALDDTLVCNCEAASLGKRECWAIALVREEIPMTTETPPTTETALVPVQLMPPQALLPTAETFASIDRAAELALAGVVARPKELDTHAKVAAAMLYGYELGLRPMTSLKHLHVIEGRVQPSAQVLAGLLEARTDARIRIVESTDKKCTLRLVWPSRGLDERWTTEWPEIERAKLATKDNWAKYPRMMLIWHTTRSMLRVFAPDVVNGIDGGPVLAPSAYEGEDGDLYNPGDEPDETVVDGHVVNTETGEIKEAERPQQTMEQYAAIKEWLGDLYNKRSKEDADKALMAIGKKAKEQFTYAIVDGRFRWTELSEADSPTFIAWLKAATEQPQTAPPDDLPFE